MDGAGLPRMNEDRLQLMIIQRGDDWGGHHGRWDAGRRGEHSDRLQPPFRVFVRVAIGRAW
ncbi:MAG: hypothetical protein OSB67_11320 [Alphaproteobacteria bacterium]|nr:hypothetical protein [Alphaproteobacteria bacterium]